MASELKIDKYIKWAIYSIFVLIPVVTNINSKAIQFNIVPNLLKEFSTFLILSLLLLLWVIKFFNVRKISFKESNTYLPILIFLIYSGTSYFFVTDIISFVEYYLRYIIFALIFLILFNFFNEQRDSNFLINIFVFSAFYISIFGIIQFIFPAFLPVYDVTNGGAGFGNKNFGAQYVTLMFPLLFLKLFKCRNIQQNLVYFFIVFTNFVYLFYVDAAQTYVALIASLLLFIFFYLIDKLRNKNERLVVFQKSSIVKISITLLILVLSNLFVDYNPKDLYSFIYDDNLNVYVWKKTDISSPLTLEKKIESFKSNALSSNGRIPMWINTFEIFKDYPILGVGTGQWYLSYFKYGGKKAKIDPLWSYSQRADHPHNEFLKLLVELGLLGSLVVLSFFIVIFNQIYKYLLNPSSEYRAEVLSLIASFSIFMGLSFFSRLSAVFVIPFLGFSFLGLAASFLKNDYKVVIFQKNIKIFLIVPIAIVVFILFLYKDRLIQDYQLRDIDVITNSDQWASKVISYKPYLPAETHMLASNLTKLGYYDDSLDRLSNLLIYRPGDIETFRLMANNYVYKGDLLNALKLYENILEINPTNHIILRAISDLMFQIKEFKHARHYYAHLKKVIEKRINGELTFDPRYFIWDEIPKLAIKFKDFKYAIDIMEKSFKYLPSRKTPLNLATLGILYFNTQNDLERAKKVFDEAISIDSRIIEEIPKEIYSQIYNESSVNE